MFNMGHKIKEECFIAFCHSRIIGLATQEGVDGEIIFSDAKRLYIDNQGVNLGNKLSEIATVDSINKKITNTKSDIIANQYYNNYNKLTKKFDNLVPKDSKLIEAVIGLSLLASFLEKDKNSIKLGIDVEYITKIITEYELVSKEHKECVSKMMRVSTKLFEHYFKGK